ncbi:MAG: hypothetical protein HDS25_08765 [Bacteroides sp.]|nr:hypothetical protein [Bacteroides sp.]
MQKRIQKFLEEVVDCQLPVEQQSMVFSLEDTVGGLTSNSLCSNRSTESCDVSSNDTCYNYAVCGASTNKTKCEAFPKLPVPDNGAVCSNTGV